MATRRQIQVADEIHQIVSHVLQHELRDPRIGFVTVTGVDVTADLKYARIAVSVMGTGEEQRETMKALTRSQGFVRRELASRMSIRVVPEVKFKHDHGVEYSDQINRLLNELREEETLDVSEQVQATAASDHADDEMAEGEAAQLAPTIDVNVAQSAPDEKERT